MNPEQALTILAQIAAAARMNAQEHDAARKAVEVLAKEIGLIKEEANEPGN